MILKDGYIIKLKSSGLTFIVKERNGLFALVDKDNSVITRYHKSFDLLNNILPFVMGDWIIYIPIKRMLYDMLTKDDVDDKL